MAYKTIITAEPDWFFVQTAKHTLKEPCVIRIAAWALTEEDEVVGLGGMQLEWDNPKIHTQLWPPLKSLSGVYKHISELSTFELHRVNGL